MFKAVERIHALVWGVPALVLILGAGLYISLRTGFCQLTLFPKALRLFFSLFRKGEKASEGATPFQALCTALGATVGTGNLVGVAGAIAIGGPGAIFWMWICALLGMATKYAEATLAVRYRVREQGDYLAGPMYTILRGMKPKWRFLGMIYSFFGVVAAFGVGNATQINAMIGGIHEAVAVFGGKADFWCDLLLGVALALILGAVLLGGVKGIGAMAERCVPLASGGYLLLGSAVLILRARAIPGAFWMILQGAFAPGAVTGGVVGSVIRTLRVGVSRGVFTNEAGMGTAGMAHGTASVSHPCQQGLMGIMEVFLDTLVICTITALVILVSGVPIGYGTDSGAGLTTAAFSRVLGSWVSVFLSLALCAFAFATVLGWGLYGVRCAQYLFGPKCQRKFAVLQALAVIPGAVLNTGTVWLLAETVNGLMAIPNLIALFVLTPELARLTKEYKRTPAQLLAGGGNYESIHQCKPVRTVPHAEVPSPGRSG